MSETSILADKLRSEGQKIIGYFESLTDEQWNTEIYTENSLWTIRNLVAHLMTSEKAFVKLFENIRQGGEGVTRDFVIDRYNASQQEKTRELGPLELLDQFKSTRQNMIKWISGVDEKDLDKIGRHPYLGSTSLREMIKMVYLHNQIHYRDVKKILNQSR
jgi:uncharacterized damage-inducible protein DinB